MTLKFSLKKVKWSFNNVGRRDFQSLGGAQLKALLPTEEMITNGAVRIWEGQSRTFGTGVLILAQAAELWTSQSLYRRFCGISGGSGKTEQHQRWSEDGKRVENDWVAWCDCIEDSYGMQTQTWTLSCFRGERSFRFLPVIFLFCHMPAVKLPLKDSSFLWGPGVGSVKHTTAVLVHAD